MPVLLLIYPVFSRSSQQPCPYASAIFQYKRSRFEFDDLIRSNRTKALVMKSGEGYSEC